MQCRATQDGRVMVERSDRMWSTGEGNGKPLQCSSRLVTVLLEEVTMQYCSLQHQNLLPSPGTSTTGYCFHFGSISSFFLVLFLQSPPVAYWAPTDLEGSSFSVLSFCLFIPSWGSQGNNTERFAIHFSNGPHFVRTLHHDLSILGSLTWHGS